MPWMNIIAVAIVGAITYVWVTRGFFSAMLNMLCVIVAGAIAFAVWEPIGYVLLEKAPNKGFLEFISGSAWGLALAIPFAAILAVLRGATDGLIRANVHVANLANYIGGGVCGLVAGILTAGIVVMSLGMLRVPTEFLGYAPVGYSSNGGVEANQGLWVPVDKLTARFYGHVSRSSFRPVSEEPLEKWYPDLHTMGGAMRVNYGMGKASNTMKPADYSITTHYKVGGPGARLNDLLTDQWNSGSQTVTDYHGGQFPADSHLEGFVIDFESGAKEKGGDTQVVLGTGQVRLVAERTDGTSMTMHPVAVITRAAGDSVDFARFRYDGQRVFIASVGGASDVQMAFEFVMPLDARPIALNVKNARTEVRGTPSTTFANAAQRDAAVVSKSLISIGGLANLDTSDAEKVDDPTNVGGTGGGAQARTRGQMAAAGLEVSNTIGRILQKGMERSLKIDSDKRVESGEQVFEISELPARGLEAALRVQRFASTSGTILVKADVSLDRPLDLVRHSANLDRASAEPTLLSVNRERFPCIGYVAEDDEYFYIRYTPGRPIRSLSEIDSAGVSPTKSRPQLKLTLIFQCSRNVEISGFVLGNKQIASFGPFMLDQRQN